MILAVAFPTWLQFASTVAAAAAVVASWYAVKQAQESLEESRTVTKEARLSLLLVSPTVHFGGAGSPTMGVEIHNAGGGVGSQVSVLLVVHNATGRSSIGFLRPGETATFGSDIHATDESRAVVFARSSDGRDFVWNHEGDRRELPRGSGLPSFEAIFAAFYPSEDVSDRRPTTLLRGDNTLR